MSEQESLGIRACYRCHRFGPFSDFYQRQTGEYLAYCKECDRAAFRARYRRHPELLAKIKEHKRQRDRRAERLREYQSPKGRARYALRYAVQKGRVAKPTACERCGKQTPRHELHGHHDDYTKALEVRWVCSPCHRAIDPRHGKRGPRRSHEL